ncbi:uncharacterized protein LOC142639503 [Castanea sativa]|uniref:uncharacterized protein LOC142639503 n=1 Tax=Castanea sativa TaxID=21020 RepID=UPI003F64F122
MDTTTGALLAQYLKECMKENVIYYISKKMLADEEKYTALEKTCVALIWATRKLKHYMLVFKVLLISRMNLLKYLIEKPVQDEKTAIWVLLLSEFDIKYVTQKSVKGRTIANHLAHCSPEEAKEIQWDFQDEDIIGIELELWKMYFDGATNQNESDIGFLQNGHISHSLVGLTFLPLIMSQNMKLALCDYKQPLVLEWKSWKCMEDSILEYATNAESDCRCFSNNGINDGGLKENQARLIVVEKKKETAYCISIEGGEEINREGEWYSNISQYLKDGTYSKSADKNDQLTIRRTSIRSSTGAIPYSLVYGMKAVLPIKMGVRSLRTVLESEIPDVDWLQSRYDQLCMMDEKRLKALYHIQGYQRRLRKAFDKKVKTRDLKTGDLVPKEIRALIQETNGKFK